MERFAFGARPRKLRGACFLCVLFVPGPATPSRVVQQPIIAVHITSLQHNTAQEGDNDDEVLAG